MGISISGTTLTFNDATTMTTAATAPSTALNGVGSYAGLMMKANNNLAIGSTIAGSSLAYNCTGLFTQNVSTQGGLQLPAPLVGLRQQLNNGTNGAGGTTVSGTWRRMDSGTIYVTATNCDGTYYNWGVALFVRIS